MKKFLSVVLALVLMMSVCVVSASAQVVDTTACAAAIEGACADILELSNSIKPDFAKTGSQDGEYYVSNEPYEDITPDNGYVLGYIGDVDGDSVVTVLDATAIQLYKAQLTTLDENAIELADVDFDWETTVLDATEIQLWIAQLSDNENITHTLFFEYSSASADIVAFDEIAEYIIEYGEYSEDGDYCYVYNYFEDIGIDYMATYYPESDEIDFYSSICTADGQYVDTIVMVYRGNLTFDYYQSMYDYDYDYYTAFGEGVLNSLNIDTNEYSFTLNNYSVESDYGITYNDIKTSLEGGILLSISASGVYFDDGGIVSNTILDLFLA